MDIRTNLPFAKQYRRNPLKFFSAIVIALLVYFYFTQFYGKEFQIFQRLPFPCSKNNYDFYSGNKSLDFYKIVEVLKAKLDEINKFFFKISIANKPTNGSLENARKIIGSQKPSIGFIQEEVVNNDEVMTNQLELIAPVFMDKLYVLYHENKLKKI